MSSAPTTHIIGAGLAGLSAAIALSGKGWKVVLYEAAPQAGGRCRSFYDKKLKMEIDNGNHLVLGSNPSVLAYLSDIGTLKHCITSEKASFPFINIATRQHFHLQPPTRYPGVKPMEWLHVFKLWRPKESQTVAALFPNESALYQRVIEPMTLAILNTAPEKASARLLRDVVFRILTAGKNGWRFFAMAHGLSTALVDPALVKIKGRGGSIYLSRAVTALQEQDGKITGFTTIKGDVELGENDRIIIATHPSATQNLLGEPFPTLEYEPILNAHFAWPQSGQFRDTMPFLGVLGGVVQWIFFHEGRISTTTSAAGEWMDEDEDRLAHRLWNDVCKALYMDNVKMPACRIIKEKRATFAATPQNIARLPEAKTRFSNVMLAGDYVDRTLPSTLEAAISSGFRAALWAMDRSDLP